jgi:hypothetical protein
MVVIGMEILLIVLCVLIYISIDQIDTKEELDQDPACDYMEIQQ